MTKAQPDANALERPRAELELVGPTTIAAMYDPPLTSIAEQLCGWFKKYSRLPVAASAYRGPALGFVTENARCLC
jgi:hypothetical protein